MAPQKPVPEHTIDRTPEYEEFIEKLRTFHTERGTKFDPEPKVGNSHLDLLKVFNHVVENGGYDKITDEKLAWRTTAAQLGVYSSNEAAVAFSLKTAYYKNLAAYEIRAVHNKTPPPPEILEELTAKGGNLLTRTLENYKRDRSTAHNSPQPSGDDGTPARDTKAEDTPSSGRAARGLRHAPPQRVIFQPDTGPSRPSNRHASGQQSSHSSNSTAHNAPQAQHHTSATPQSNGHGQPHSVARHSTPQMSHGSGPIPQVHSSRGATSASFTPANFEYHSATVAGFQRQEFQTLPIRPVETPANAPGKFARPRHVAAVPAAPRQAPLPSSTLIPKALMLTLGLTMYVLRSAHSTVSF